MGAQGEEAREMMSSSTGTKGRSEWDQAHQFRQCYRSAGTDADHPWATAHALDWIG